MIIGLTFLLCVIVHTLAPFASLRIIPGFSSLSLPIRQSWYHRLVSSLHALVMSSLVVRYWGRVNINLAVSDAIGPLQKTSLDVMVGFLFYGILFESLLSKSYDTAMYYLVGLVIHLLTRYSDSGVSMYHLMALYLSELSTPLLHFTWLLLHLRYDTTPLFHLLQGLLLLVFFVCRLLIGSLIFLHLLLYKSLWRHQVSLYYFCSFVYTAFLVMNVKWFRSLVMLALRWKTDNANDRGDT